MLRVLPGNTTRLDGSLLLALVGVPAWRAVDWTCSSGLIEALNTYTNEEGRAFALWTPAAEGAATIGATYGA